MMNNTIFFGFAMSDSMFNGNVTVNRREMTVEEVKAMQGDLTPCLNPSHAATINAMRVRFGLDLEIPERPPVVALEPGDSLIVMGVRGLPRLTDRHEYTGEEIAAATFKFAMWTVE